MRDGGAYISVVHDDSTGPFTTQRDIRFNISASSPTRLTSATCSRRPRGAQLSTAIDRIYSLAETAETWRAAVPTYSSTVMFRAPGLAIKLPGSP